MNHNNKIVRWATIIIGSILIGLIIFFSFRVDEKNTRYCLCGLLILVLVRFFILWLLKCINRMKKIKRINDKKRELPKEKVARKKSLPVYSNRIYIVILLGIFSPFLGSYWIIESDYVHMLIIIIILLLLLLKPIPRKMLYLCKDDKAVLNYDSNIDISSIIYKLNESLGNSCYFIKKKCERIELKNHIEIWSCFSIYHYLGFGTHYNEIIFSTAYYNSQNDINIILNNRLTTYLQKDNIYVSRYSNLPPFVINNEISENVCNHIAEVCSNFFAKTRDNYVLMIQNGSIGLGIGNARFGKINRIFNKNKTRRLTGEAVEEISQFMLEIKSILERY